ncbi:MAG TPA: hypothetical protein VFM18_02895 [Methanosarcina sp.]|nr:hypothetical protein [Methanosarcina sp.]
MRCACCNKILSDFEATRRHAVTGEFLDICNKCFEGLGIPALDRTDLPENEETVDDMEESFVESDWEDDLPEMS